MKIENPGSCYAVDLREPESLPRLQVIELQQPKEIVGSILI